MRNKTQIIINADGEWMREKIVYEPIDGESIVRASSAARKMLLPLLGKRTWMNVKDSTNFTVIREMENVRFRSGWVLDGNARELGEIWVPTLSEGSGMRVDEEFTYTPPPDMSLLFFANTTSGYSYLVAMDKINLGLYHPPLPNIYGSGKICMGGAPTPSYNPTYGIDYFLNAHLDSWGDAEWNRDLIDEMGGESMDGVYRAMRFNAETRTSVPRDEDWRNFVGGRISPSDWVVEATEAMIDANLFPKINSLQATTMRKQALDAYNTAHKEAVIA